MNRLRHLPRARLHVLERGLAEEESELVRVLGWELEQAWVLERGLHHRFAMLVSERRADWSFCK